MFERRKSGLIVPNQRIITDGLLAKGTFHIVHKRDGKVIDEETVKNLVVDEGINYILSAGLGGGSQISSWFLGLFEGNYTPVAGDTAATIAASATETSTYVGGSRKAWTPNPGGVSGKAITNTAARGDFVFNNTSQKNIYGAFLISSATIGGTTGKLFSALRFATVKPVNNADELLVTYTFTGSSA